MNEIKCEITKSTNVYIKAKTPSVDLNEPLYAINWFSTKLEWMYHLYNFLASKSLKKVVEAKDFLKEKSPKLFLMKITAKEI